MIQIKGLEKSSLIDYPGKLSAVIFLGGCNFRCPFCHNRNLVLEPEGTESIPENEILDFLKDREKWLDGVCMSIANNENVLIKESGKIRNIPIESLWNDKDVVVKSGTFESQKCNGIEAFTSDCVFRKVSEIMRHKTKEIYDIKLSSGYSISATGSHSVFVLTKNGLKEKEVSTLKTSDYLVSPKKIPIQHSIKHIRTSDFFALELEESRTEMMKRKDHWTKILDSIRINGMSFSSAERKYGHNRHTISRFMKAYESGRLDEFCYISRPNLLWKSDGFLWAGRTKLIPLFIPVTSKLCELLGYIVAEGSMRTNSYTLTLGDEPKLARRILSLYRHIFKTNSGVIRKFKARTGNYQYSLILGGRFIDKLFDRLVGHRAENKKIPYVIFNTNRGNQLKFILALNAGDGHIRERLAESSEEFSIKTISKKLASDTVILLKFFGLHPLVSEEREKGSNRRTYKIYFHGNQYFKLGLRKKIKTKYSFLTALEGIPKELLGMENHAAYQKQERLNIRDVPMKFRNEAYNIAQKWSILKVKDISKRKTSGYVYDLVVPINNSFLGGIGGILLHNTGGEPTIHKDLPEFLKNLKGLGYAVKLDTNGSNPKMVKELVEKGLVDYIAMDIKAPLRKYEKSAGVKANTENIKESIKLIINSGIGHEFRSTILPSLHSKEDVQEMARLVKGASKLYLQQFRPKNTIDPTFEGKRPFSEKEMKELRDLCRKYVDTEVRLG